MLARLAAAMSIAILVWTVLAGASAQAVAAGEYHFEGPVTLIVGSGPGGGHDIYARLLARHLGGFLPGMFCTVT